jgi:SecD/SecF fusion protein
MRTSKWVLGTYIFIIIAGIILALPNIFTKAQLDALPNWLPKKQISLGLDLRGGSYLVLEVDAAALKKDRVRAMLDDASPVIPSS